MLVNHKVGNFLKSNDVLFALKVFYAIRFEGKSVLSYAEPETFYGGWIDLFLFHRILPADWIGLQVVVTACVGSSSASTASISVTAFYTLTF